MKTFFLHIGDINFKCKCEDLETVPTPLSLSWSTSVASVFLLTLGGETDLSFDDSSLWCCPCKRVKSAPSSTVCFSFFFMRHTQRSLIISYYPNSKIVCYCVLLHTLRTLLFGSFSSFSAGCLLVCFLLLPLPGDPCLLSSGLLGGMGSSDISSDSECLGLW